MKSWYSLPLTLLLALSATAYAANAQPAKIFDAKLMATMDRLDDPHFSPDGRYVLYSLRQVDYAANKGTMSLWLLDVNSKAARRLAISEGGASSGRFSPDGKSIYFLSSRNGGEAQVFRTDISGASAEQVTNLPVGVDAFKIAPNGKSLVIALAVFPDCPSLTCTKERLDAKAANKSAGQVYDRLFVRHWDTWADGTRNHLYAVKLDEAGKAGEPVALMTGFDGDSPTKPFGGDEDFTITPDSKSVVFSAKWAGKDESWKTNFDLWRVPLSGGAKPEDLTTANKAWDAAAAFSADGHWSAWRAMKRPGFEADRFGIMLRDEKSGQVRELTAGWDRSAESIAFSPDGKTLYATAEDMGQGKLFAIDIASGAIRALTDQGTVAAFDVGPKGIVIAQSSLKSPNELYTLPLNGGAAVQISHVSTPALGGVAWGEPEQFAFPGWNKEIVHGYVIKPANFKPGKSYPVAFLIHGGPQGSFGNGWSYRWNPQIYTNAGYAVVMIDFHGSTGYGQKFTDSISQHWGDRPLEDLQKGWAYALAHYPYLNGNKACALGASYGGYMINWIAGSWNEPWKCLVDHDGVFDARGMGYSTEELWFDEWEHGGTFFDKPEAYEAFNPATKVKNWKKPMMVIHGGHDFRIPEAQGLGSFTALQRQGIESKLLYFPDENHWVLKPQNSVQWHTEVLGWLDRWTK